MNQYINTSCNDEYQIPSENRRTSLFLILLVPFIITAVSISKLPAANYIVVGLGLLCSLTYFLISIWGTLYFPKEIWLFLAYIVWSLLGGFNAMDPNLFFIKLFTLFQLIVMVIIIVHYSNSERSVRILLFSVLIGAAVVGMSAYITGDYQRANAAGERAAGFAINSNTFAITLVFAAAILLYLFKTLKSWILKGGIITLLPVIACLIVSSGSRKGFICFLLLIFLWFAFSYGREIIRRPMTVIAIMFLFIGVASFLCCRMEGTTLEKRIQKMQEAVQGGSGDYSIVVRKEMIAEGINIIQTNPFLGIGLNNYRLYSSSGWYSHNNYIEVCTNSGIPALMLYYAIFMVLMLRLQKLSKLQLDERSREFVIMAKTFIIVLLIVDMVVVTYSEKMNWIILAILIGWSYRLERDFIDHSLLSFLKTS